MSNEILEYMGDGIIVFDISGKVIDVNPAYERMTGLNRKDVIGKNGIEVASMTVKADSVDRIIATFRSALAGESIPLTTTTLIRRDGKEIPVCYTTSFIKTAKGEPQSIIAVIKDIHDLKRTEEALRESEHIFRVLFNQSHHLIGLMQVDGTLIKANSTALEFAGIKESDVIGCPFWETPWWNYSEEQRERLRHAVIEAAHGNLVRFETYHLDADGHVHIIDFSIKPVKDENNNVVLLIPEGLDITERKNTEEALQIWMHRYDLIVDASGQVVYEYIVPTGDITWGRSIEKVLGYSLEEISGGFIQWQELLHPDDKEATFRLLDAAEKACVYWDAEYRMRHKAGHFVWIRDRGFFLPDAQGNAYKQIGMLEDITGQKQAEQALHESEIQFRALAEYSRDTIMRFDRLYRHLYVNPMVESQTGIKPEAFMGKTHREVGFPEELCCLWEDSLKGVFETGEVRRIEFPLPNGIWIDWLLAPETDAHGKVVAVVTSARDITHLKQAEKALKENEARYRLLAENASDIIFTMDMDLRFTYISPSIERIRGYTPEEAMSQSLSDALTPASLDAALAAFQEERELEVREPREIWRKRTLELEECCKDGSTIWTETTFTPLRDEEKRFIGFIGITRDITERKKAAEIKERLEMQLSQAQKMESVGRLAGGIAHDFNNMLSVILGNTELAMSRIDPAEPLHKSLRDILQAAQRSADLTRQLLTFARKQITAPKVLDLNDTVSGMLKMLRRLIGEDIDLGWYPGHNLWSVKIDPSQVDQLLANLMVNARDAIDGVGKITIETSNTVLDESECSGLPECLPGKYVLLAVNDDGHGMDKETLAHIFEPFFTTKKEGQGTGLGLATVYGIVKQNNGFICADSEPGQGTTFRIYLPRYGGESQEAGEDKAEVKLLGGTETVLIVEDEAAVMNLIKNLLERLGYHVLAAGRTDEAIRLARDCGESIDLLLTDVVMPDMNGKELAERISAMQPALKCLYMSGYTADVITRQGILEEGVHFITKPFTLKDLAIKIRETLA